MPVRSCWPSWRVIRGCGSRRRCPGPRTPPRAPCRGSHACGTARSSRSTRRGSRAIDLSGAFRIRDDAARTRWYPATGSLPAGAAYGLTEHYKAEIRDAALVANPGCYPTAALLSLLPLAKAGLLDVAAGAIVD